MQRLLSILAHAAMEFDDVLSVHDQLFRKACKENEGGPSCKLTTFKSKNALESNSTNKNIRNFKKQIGITMEGRGDHIAQQGMIEIK